MEQAEKNIDVHWLWLNDSVALSRMRDTICGMQEGQTLKLSVSFNGLKSLCNRIAQEGGRVLRVEAMRGESGYLVVAAK